MTKKITPVPAQEMFDDEPFQQSDFEFALDTMSDRSAARLRQHLEAGTPESDPDTAEFLRAYLLDMPVMKFHDFD